MRILLSRNARTATTARTVLAWAAALSCGIPALVAQEGPDSRAKVIAASELNLRRFLSGPVSVDVEPQSGITLTPIVDGVAFSVRLMRATAWTSTHSPPLILGIDSTKRLWKLGGFQESEALELASSLPLRVTDSAETIAASLWLARALDPNGSVSISDGHGSRPEDGKDPWAAWTDRRPIGWPTDTMIRHADGHVLVRLTVLSISAHLVGSPWQPLAYAFEYDAEGVLIGWRLHQGVSFPS